MRNFLSIAAASLALAASASAADKTIAEIASGDERFTTLVAALEAADLVDAFNDPAKKATVFAPTNEAFEKLPDGTLDELLKPGSKRKLARILKYHVVEGPVSADDLKSAKSAKTLQGKPIELLDGGKVGNKTTSAKLVATDVEASNGMIHVIDTVLTPPGMKLKSSKVASEGGKGQEKELAPIGAVEEGGGGKQQQKELAPISPTEP